MTRHIVTHRDGAVDEVRQCWRTPPDFAARIVERYGITIDVAAHRGNRIVPRHLGPGSSLAVDALTSTAWGYHGNVLGARGVAFCNPPFRLALAFARKGLEAVLHAGRPLASVVYLLPCNLDTRWARLLWEHCATFNVIHGRLRFAPPVDEDGAPIAGIPDQRGAAFPMVLVELSGARAREAVRRRAEGEPATLISERPLCMIDTKGDPL